MNEVGPLSPPTLHISKFSPANIDLSMFLCHQTREYEVIYSVELGHQQQLYENYWTSNDSTCTYSPYSDKNVQQMP